MEDESGASPPGSVSAEAAGGDRISLHHFCGRLAEQLVHFHAMRLQGSLFLWVGEAPQLRNLAVAMCTPRDSIPASTLLLGDTSDNTSNALAQRLASLEATSCLLQHIVMSFIDHDPVHFPESISLKQQQLGSRIRCLLANVPC